MVEFVSGHLRNNLRTEKSFLYVEKFKEKRNTLGAKRDIYWEVVAVDADWETQIIWYRDRVWVGQSKVQIKWAIPLDTSPGIYRIRHVGYYKVRCLTELKVT